MPLTQQEVSALVDDAGAALQQLQDEFGSRNVPGARVRFPRGFIGTAVYHRTTLPKIGTEVQRRNASYALMNLDLFRWVATRTDLSATSLSILMKECICVLGVLCEWLTKAALHGRGSKSSYKQRTAKLVAAGEIDAALKDELDWVWEVRCKEHFSGTTTLEHEEYTRSDSQRAVKAYDALRDALVAIHSAAP